MTQSEPDPQTQADILEQLRRVMDVAHILATAVDPADLNEHPDDDRSPSAEFQDDPTTVQVDV